MPYLAVIFLLFSHSVLAFEFSSGDTKATVVELYTSEGCSSCPAADKWLSTLKDEPRLFKDVIPMAFHVDYWDYLGWKDPWAQAAFSERQRQLAGQGTYNKNPAFVGLLSQVYTPAFTVAGREWSGWYRNQKLPRIKQEKTGILSAQLNGQQLTVQYSDEGDYELNIAYLGMGLVSKVIAGENRSRELHHDFVVLTLLKQTGSSTWQLDLPAIPKQSQQQTAISIWLTKVDSLAIEQAVAGVID